MLRASLAAAAFALAAALPAKADVRIIIGAPVYYAPPPRYYYYPPPPPAYVVVPAYGYGYNYGWVPAPPGYVLVPVERYPRRRY